MNWSTKEPTNTESTQRSKAPKGGEAHVIVINMLETEFTVAQFCLSWTLFYLLGKTSLSHFSGSFRAHGCFRFRSRIRFLACEHYSAKIWKALVLHKCGRDRSTVQVMSYLCYMLMPFYRTSFLLPNLTSVQLGRRT